MTINIILKDLQVLSETHCYCNDYDIVVIYSNLFFVSNDDKL